MTEQDYNNCVDSHADGVYRFIVKNIRNKEDARDIVQSAFEKLWIHRDTVAIIKAKSYLYTVAYHQMIDILRQEKRKPTTNEFHDVDQVTHQTSSELKQQLLWAINQLNHTQKSLILLKDYEGYSYQEIGEIMNLSESQEKVYLHRARLFLKSKLLQLEKVNA